MKKLASLLTSLIVLVSAPIFAANISDNLKASIEGVANQPTSILFTLENTSPDLTIRFVRWHTPLEGTFTKDIFLVTLNGAIQSYQGRVLRRRPPQSSDYITLNPGEKVSTAIDLSGVYDMTQSGSYRIQFRSNLLDVEVVTASSKRSANTAPNAERITSQSLLLNLSNASKRTAPAQVAEASSFSSCSASQTNWIQDAHNRAIGLASESKNAMANTTAASRPTAARYVKWFGSYSSARYQRVLDAFNKMSTALNTQNIQYICDCDQYFEQIGVYAFVYSNDEYNVHICQNTFSLGVTGSDTRAGTIIHELSHFTVLGGTDDHGYGYNTALSLAISNPSNAVDNAENYLFFAENIPNLTNGTAQSGGSSIVIAPILQLLL
ncbi:MAG: peptidyl-Lys metalloendopeptidase [Saprospiraceae bacterium]|jgi:peptidyl-Lys metalloendopeptidase